jgi:hypothetical protein
MPVCVHSSFRAVTRQIAMLARRGLIVGAVAYLAMLALPGTYAGAVPAGSARADHRITTSAAALDQRRKRLAVQLAAAVRDSRDLADQAVRAPTSPILRIGFSTDMVLLRALIREIRKVGGLGREANAAELVADREEQRVRRAWREADQKAETAAVVQQLQSVMLDAARASGAKTEAELNAFKKAHLSDIKYAGRRWLVDRKVGRQGAVFLARGVRNPRLRDAIEQLYKYPAKKGDGGTGDALLSEVKAGCRGRACEHFVKANERRTQLLKILSEERLTVTERRIAGELVGALNKAIRVAGGT